jgi:hypothetical protein
MIASLNHEQIVSPNTTKSPTMPHSVSSSNSLDQENEENMPDAPPTETVNGLVQEETGGEANKVEDADQRMKLEDMFSDDEEQDEEPSGSDAADINMDEAAV